MNKNEIVCIYSDHLTKNRLEGIAKLIKRVPCFRDSDKSENWIVEFLSDKFKCERMVSL